MLLEGSCRVGSMRFGEYGQFQANEPFISGWLFDDGEMHFGRLVGMAVVPEGSLLVGAYSTDLPFIAP